MKQQGSYEKLFNYYNKEQKILKNLKKGIDWKGKGWYNVKALKKWYNNKISKKKFESIKR